MYSSFLSFAGGYSDKAYLHFGKNKRALVKRLKQNGIAMEPSVARNIKMHPKLLKKLQPLASNPFLTTVLGRVKGLSKSLKLTLGKRNQKPMLVALDRSGNKDYVDLTVPSQQLNKDMQRLEDAVRAASDATLRSFMDLEKGPIFYFAYGSNLNPFQMQARCGGAKMVGRGKLRGYRRQFVGKSQNWQGAVANVTHSRHDDKVSGVVYQISPANLETLDKCEGRNYAKRLVTVRMKKNGKEIKKKAILYTWINTNNTTQRRPSKKYIRKIQEGADYWRLKNARDIRRLRFTPLA